MRRAASSALFVYAKIRSGREHDHDHDYEGETRQAASLCSHVFGRVDMKTLAHVIS